ncbi:MAG: Hint domain-containing protein [Jhaorihella sp.]
MGFNIKDVGGETAGGPSNWNATLDLTLSSSATISGDFNAFVFGDVSAGEASDGYTFSALSNTSFGTLTTNSTTGTYTFTPNWANIAATGSDQVVSFTVTGTDGGSSETDTVVINLLICVARGTRIATTRGPVAVEDLACGDLVCTMDGAPQPVRWIGSRRVPVQEMTRDPSLRPVRFEPDAMGAGRPERALRVSPQHRVFLQDWRAQLMFGEDQVLVPAKSLVNDSTVRREAGDEDIEYFHILFDEHQIMFTEGLATESFHPGAYTLAELDAPVRRELLKLFPHLQDDTGYGAVARPALRPWEARMLQDAIEQPDSP